MKQTLSRIGTVAALCLAGLVSGCAYADKTPKPGAPAHHLANGGFINPPGSAQSTASVGEFISFLLNQWLVVTAPPVPDGHVLKPAEAERQLAMASNPSVTWLGHAAFMIRIGGKVVLTDPFLGKNAGPWTLGPKRLVAPPFAAKDLPKADVLIVSHNHYDHLDAPTIEAYPYKKETQVIVPLGLGSFFTQRGYQKVQETDWWDNWSEAGLSVTTLPAVHFSGRGIADRNDTLWASFALEAGGEKVWFSGDTARGAVFGEIGRRAGPFDLALIGIGSYEPQSIMVGSHATPEEAVEIARQVGATKAVGMHWGTIMLTPEDPFEAAGRFRQAAVDQGYGAENAWILKVGETRAFQ